MSQQNILRSIQIAQHGQCSDVTVILMKGENIIMSQQWATHHLAWAAGENWCSLNEAHGYKIEET